MDYFNNLLCYLDIKETMNKLETKEGADTYVSDVAKDDNDEILRLLRERLNLGRKRYGHGVIVDENTQKYGTRYNDWDLMALEELLDGLIYATAAIIRHKRNKYIQLYDPNQTNDDIVVDYRK